MRTLMYTTAIVSVTAFGAVAQTTGYGEGTAAQAGQMVPAFKATNFIGKNLYTLDTDAVRDLQQTEATHDARSLRWTSDETFMAERDAWENVGSIDDVILTQDGQIRGVIVDVGGFLGFMAHTVMVDLESLYFVADDAEAEDIGDFNVVAAVSRERLEELPEWDDAQLEVGFEPRPMAAAEPQMNGESDMAMDDPETTGQTDMATAEAGDDMVGSPRGPAEAPEGYVQIDSPPSADALIGADVYDAHGESIGQVDDVVIGDDNSVTHLVLDIGGFLGIGNHVVALEMQDLDLFHDQESDSLRVHAPMTEEQLESLPEYES